MRILKPRACLALMLALAGQFPSPARAETPVVLRAVGPVAADFNPDFRLLRRGYPARFRVTLVNTSERACRGTIVAEVIGDLDTIHGLTPQAVALGPGEEVALSLAWDYPRPTTFAGSGGPISLPGATWGHALRVAYREDTGQTGPSREAVFVIDQDGTCDALARKLARAVTLTPAQAFALRYSGYLSNPAFSDIARPEELTMTLRGGAILGWQRGVAPSGRQTYLARLAALPTDSMATVTIPRAAFRLRRAWLFDPERQGARPLYHRPDQRTFSFVVPACPRATTLVLELAPGDYHAPVPLADMADRGARQFGPFRDLRSDGKGATATTPTAWADRRKVLAAIVRQNLGTALQRKQGPLEPRLVSEETVVPRLQIGGLARAYIRRKISLRDADGERMNVWLLVPPGIGPFPALVACHQTVSEGKDEVVGLGGNPFQLSFGPLLASRGYVVIAGDCYAAGERVRGAVRHAYDTAAKEKADPDWSNLGQRLVEHRRLIDYLETLPYVDRTRIGAIGHSLGGESVTMLTALDERIAAAVVSCGFTLLRSLDKAADIYALSGDTILSKRWRKLLQAPVPDRRLPFDFDDCMALWAPRPVYLHDVRDELWPNAAQVAQAAQELRRVYAVLGAEDRLAVQYSAQAHCFPLWVQDEAFDWLDYWLKDRSSIPARRR